MHRNFMGYTVLPCPDTIAIGASAISKVRGAYFQNHKDLPDYHGAIDQKSLPVAKGIIMDGEDQFRAELIETLMCQFRLEPQRIAAKHGLDFSVGYETEKAHLERCEKEGLIESMEDSYRVTERGRLLVRNIAVGFDDYFHRREATYSKALSFFHLNSTSMPI